MNSVLALSKLILASSSPRRQLLLRQAGYLFDVVPADVDELDFPSHLAPGEVAEFLAAKKASAISRRFPRDLVLAADTVVALGDRMLGKPADGEDAARMLRLLGGTTHSVMTGVAVMRADPLFDRLGRVVSSVRMRVLSEKEISDYVACGDWEGKAGGYGIQDDDPFVTRTSGCLSNIVGLPMTTTCAWLGEAGLMPGSP